MEDCKEEPTIAVNELCEPIEPAPKVDYYDKIEVLKRHNVTFNFADAGCTVSIGCRTYCFSENIVDRKSVV